MRILCIGIDKEINCFLGTGVKLRIVKKGFYYPFDLGVKWTIVLNLVQHGLL